MRVILAQLSLMMLTVIQLASSQYTDEVIQAVSDVSSCESNEYMISELVNVVSQLRTAVAQLERKVTEPKTDTGLKDASSKLMDQNY